MPFLPLGEIVAIARLCSVRRTEDVIHQIGENEEAFGDYSGSRYAWCLEDVVKLRKPVPCKGALGLWTVPADIAAQITEKQSRELVMAHVCGGKQARICRVTGKEHDMSAIVRFSDGGSVACKDCGVTAMQIDMMALP